MNISARPIADSDPDGLVACFAGTPWDRGVAFFQNLVTEHRAGSRAVWVGTVDDDPVGFGSLLWTSSYPPFREEGVAEISDLNVAPSFRRRGVASCIIAAAELRASERGVRVGIGVGLHSGYGSAQRLYVALGYIPDGRGVSHKGRFPDEGELIPNDDDLVLHFYKGAGSAS